MILFLVNFYVKINKINWYIIYIIFLIIQIGFNNLFGDWGLGIGDWGLGIGPKPQTPNPNNKIY